MLLRTPLFTICTIAALAIGIGATTALFSVVHALLVKPLPYPDADRLVVMWEHNLPRNRPRNVISPANFLEWRDAQPIVRRHGGVHAEPRHADRQRRAAGAVDRSSSPPTCSTCSAWRRCSGAASRAGEDQEGAARTMVLSHAAWLRQFGGDTSVIGRTLTINGEPVTVIGVMPRGFEVFGLPADVVHAVPLRPRRCRFTRPQPRSASAG